MPARAKGAMISRAQWPCRSVKPAASPSAAGAAQAAARLPPAAGRDAVRTRTAKARARTRPLTPPPAILRTFNKDWVPSIILAPPTTFCNIAKFRDARNRPVGSAEGLGPPALGRLGKARPGAMFWRLGRGPHSPGGGDLTWENRAISIGVNIETSKNSKPIGPGPATVTLTVFLTGAAGGYGS